MVAQKDAPLPQEHTSDHATRAASGARADSHARSSYPPLTSGFLAARAKAAKGSRRAEHKAETGVWFNSGAWTVAARRQ